MFAALIVAAAIGQSPHIAEMEARIHAANQRALASRPYQPNQVPRPYDFRRNPYSYGPPGIYDPTAPPVGPQSIGYGTYQTGPTYVPPRFRYPQFVP